MVKAGSGGRTLHPSHVIFCGFLHDQPVIYLKWVLGRPSLSTDKCSVRASQEVGTNFSWPSNKQTVRILGVTLCCSRSESNLFKFTGTKGTADATSPQASHCVQDPAQPVCRHDLLFSSLFGSASPGTRDERGDGACPCWRWWWTTTKAQRAMNIKEIIINDQDKCPVRAW